MSERREIMCSCKSARSASASFNKQDNRYERDKQARRQSSKKGKPKKQRTSEVSNTRKASKASTCGRFSTVSKPSNLAAARARRSRSSAHAVCHTVSRPVCVGGDTNTHNLSYCAGGDKITRDRRKADQQNTSK
jgi:hypothetical protein